MKTKYEIFVDSIAYVLEDHSLGTTWFYDFDEQNIVPFCKDVDCLPEEGHRVLCIEPLPSWKSFQMMEAFVESLADRTIQDKLYAALRRRHPFSAFKNALCYAGVRDAWFIFRDEWMTPVVEEWMHDNDVLFQDDCVICNSSSVYEYSRDDE